MRAGTKVQMYRVTKSDTTAIMAVHKQQPTGYTIQIQHTRLDWIVRVALLGTGSVLLQGSYLPVRTPICMTAVSAICAMSLTIPCDAVEDEDSECFLLAPSPSLSVSESPVVVE
jgi:hypothetical protein